MRKLLLLLLILAPVAYAERAEFRVLKFWSESENYLPFEPVIMHAFVLNAEGSPAVPQEGLKIHVQIDKEGFSKSVNPTFDQGKNHYVINGGVLTEGTYTATLYIEKEAFFASQEISFAVKNSKYLKNITLGEPISLKKGQQAAKDSDIMVEVRIIDLENATLMITNKNATKSTGVISDGGTATISGFDITILRIMSGDVKLVVDTSKPITVTTSSQIPNTTSTFEEVIPVNCDGCLGDDKNCHLVGSHFVSGVEAVYCAEDHQTYPQKSYKEECTINYQCYDYSCIEGLCKEEVKYSLWQRITMWLNGLFS